LFFVAALQVVFVRLSSHYPEFGQMKRFIDFARNFATQEDGAALVEYGMLLLLIAVLVIVTIKSVGTKVSKGFESVNSSLP
jgi:pilus assembly protein Flp/PilA